MTLRQTAIALAAAAAFAGPAAAQEVAVITPYLAQPGTQFYVDGFSARAAELGWTVNVIDTAGDVAAVISRIEDVVNQGVKAIVINVDPAQIGAGLKTAADAGIPVVGMDAGSDPLVAANITSADATAGSVESLEGSSLTIGTEGGVTVNDANVIVADITGINGTAHAIDKVLLPPGVRL